MGALHCRENPLSLDSLVSQALQRQRWISAAGLALIAALAWAYLVSGIGAVPMPMQMGDRVMWEPWGAKDWLLTFAMWAVMMTAMMLPPAAPMILLFVGLHERQQPGAALGPTWSFLAGYLLVWTGFAAAATSAQWGLHSAALLSPMLKASSPYLAAGLLLAAGAYQWTPLKLRCLARCRQPLGFLMTEWRAGTGGALRMGLRHGLFCTGCCWALMALLFVGGVMNLLWVALLSAYVLLEKVLPGGAILGRVAGAALLAWAVWLAAAGLH